MNKKPITQIESKFNMYSALYILFALAGYFLFGMINIGSFSVLEWFKFIPLIIIGIEYVIYFILDPYKNHKVMKKSLFAIIIGFGLESILYIGNMIIHYFNFMSVKSFTFFLSYLLSFIFILIYFCLFMIMKMREEKKIKRNLLITLIPIVCFLILFLLSNINPFVTKKTDDGVDIVGYLPLALNRREIDVPDTIGKSKVVGIRNEAFKYNQSLEIIKVSSNVIKIDEEAFKTCYKLKEVRFKDDSMLEYIGEGAFKTCIYLNVLDLPKTIKYIGSEAFCGSGIDVDFSYLENLEYIGDKAFELCYNLKDLRFNSDKLSYLGVGAFNNTSITNLEFSDKVNLERIEEEAFSSCYYLLSIDFHNANIKEIGMRAFVNSVSLPTIRFNNNLESLDFASFGGSGIMNVYMNDGFIDARGNPFGEFSKTTFNYTLVKSNIKIYINSDFIDDYSNARGYTGYENCFEYYK